MKRCFVVWFANASPLPTFFIFHNVIHPLITTSSSSPKVTYFTKIIIIIITLPVMLAGRSYMFCMSTEFIVSRMVMCSILIITLHFLWKRFLVFLKYNNISSRILEIFFVKIKNLRDSFILIFHGNDDGKIDIFEKKN